MPIDYTEKEACGVGRIRVDHALKNGLALWVVGDQLWKGRGTECTANRGSSYRAKMPQVHVA